jgi:hypothetical protein
MEWREIDIMMVSKCIEHIEKEMTDGKLEAPTFIPVRELEESKAFMLYRACRVHLVDRMMEEYDKIRSETHISDLTNEFQEDVVYFKKVQKRE